ncbi:hypothetical protein [Microbacterium sp.]
MPFVDFGLEDALIHAAVFVPLGVLVPLLTARPRRWKAVAIVLATRSTAVAGFVERFRWPARERPRSQPGSRSRVAGVSTRARPDASLM